MTTRHEGDDHLHALSQRLDEAATRRDLALDYALLGWWDWDIQRDQLWWSSNMFRLYDISPDLWDTEGFKGWSQFIVQADLQPTLDRLWGAVRDPAITYQTSFRIRTPNDEIRLILATGRVLRDPSGAGVRMVGINLLITHPLAEQIARSVANAADVE